MVARVGQLTTSFERGGGQVGAATAAGWRLRLVEAADDEARGLVVG